MMTWTFTPLRYILLALLIPGVLFAQSDQFTVQLTVGSDTMPPTTPANLTATPVATTQIDLDWDASSDDFAVGGYQVFRDSVQIATTTLTSYADTGLSESTLYAYFIRAFDTSFNVSSSSATVATTTLTTPTSTPTTTPPADSGGGGSNTLELQDIELLSFDVTTTEHEMRVSLRTNVYTKAVFRWGRTTNYELGYTTSDAYKHVHRTYLDMLDAGTVYEGEFILTNRTGEKTIRKTFQFRTMQGPDITAPANVSNLQAFLEGEGVRLVWDNPDDIDFSHVRIMSSDQFYPTHIADGWFVYEGNGTGALDARTIREGQRRYYTVFTYDTAGNTSSGAVTSVVRGVPAIPTGEDATTTEDIPAMFLFEQLRFIQEKIEQPIVQNQVLLFGERNTTISLPYGLVPEHLKSIVITLAHPKNQEKVFSFLLRINAEKTAYEAHIGPLIDPGLYMASVELFDYTRRQVSIVEGDVVVVPDYNDEEQNTRSLLRHWILPHFGIVIISFVVVLLLLILYAFGRIQRKTTL